MTGDESTKTIKVFLNDWINNNLDLFENDFNNAGIFSKEFIEATIKSDFKKLRELIGGLPKKNKIIEEYVSKIESIQTSFTKESKGFVVDDMLVNVLSIGIDNDSVKKINEPISYDECLATTEEIYNKTKLFVFLISSPDTVSGKIIGKLRENKLRVELANRYAPKRKDLDDYNLYFGQGSARTKSVKSLAMDFYSYIFEDSGSQYILLSVDEIKSTRVKVKGCVVSVSDRINAGESFQLPVNMNVVFVNSFEEEKRTFTEEEVRDIVGVPSRDELTSMFFGRYGHPEWLQNLIMAWSFASPIEGYPLHLLILGPPKTGKTKSIIEPLFENIPDVRHNGESTFKGLVPSFGGNSSNGFNEGALLKADRICYLDEFTTPICTGSHNYADISNQLGKMNGILEWHVGEVASGNGKSLSCVTPTMQILACGNYQKGFDDIIMMGTRLNNAALSRLCIYSQNRENIDYIKNNSSKVMAIPWKERLPKKTDTLRTLFDFFKMEGVVSNMDYKWVSKKVDEYESIVPVDLKDVYVRYDHHLACILDGVSKTRWVVGEKESFYDVDAEDYKQAEEIFQVIVSSWIVEESEIANLPKWARVKHLRTNERVLYEHISNYGGITNDELNEKFGNWASAYQILTKYELIYQHEEKYYAYWHNYVKEKELEVAHSGQNSVSQWNN